MAKIQKDDFHSRILQDDEENLSVLYKYFEILDESQTELFRKLTRWAVERILHGSQDEKHLGYEEELRLLEGWDCAFRALVYRFDKHTKKICPKIDCGHPTTRQIRGTTIMDISVCKKCHDRDGSTKLLSVPKPKKSVSKSTQKRQPKPVQEREHRKCANPNCDNICYKGDMKKFPEVIPRYCLECWFISKMEGFQGWDKPIQGCSIGGDFNGKLKVEEKPREPQFDSHGNELSDAEVSARFHETNGTRQSHEEWNAERAQKEHDKLSDEIQKELEQEQQSKEE